MEFSSSSRLFLVGSQSFEAAADRPPASNVVWVPFGLRRPRRLRHSVGPGWFPEPPDAA